MNNKDFLNIYLQKLTERIKKLEQQWKGTRYASIEKSAIDPEDQDEDQNLYQQILEKYRGKNGDIKPLGLILYNKYLRSLFILFIGLTLLFVPVAILYSFGNGLSEIQTHSFSKAILLISIANLPHYRLDDIDQQELAQISFQRYLIISTDVIAIIVFFAFIVYLKIQLKKITYNYKAKCPQPHLYCLQVQNIQGFKQQQILNHFQKLGKVAQISGVYSHHNTIYDLDKMIKLVSYLRVLKPQQALYQTTVQKIRNKYYELAQNYLKFPTPSLKSVFICFEQIVDRNRVYDLYKYQISGSKLDLIREQRLENMASDYKLLSSSNLKKQKQIQSMSQNHETKIHFENTDCPENMSPDQSKRGSRGIIKITRPKVKKCQFQPLTINWENCDIEKKSQRLKFCCQSVLLVVVTFVILIGLFLLNINSTHIKQQYSKNFLQHQRDVESQNSLAYDRREKYTFCASLKLTEIKWQHYSLCSQFFQLQRNRFVLMLAFSLMVAVINLLTNRILWALVAFRRYRTIAQRNHFLITSIFIFSFINSAILTLLIREKNIGLILRAIVGKILNFSQDAMQVTVFSQFNRQWYLMIGSQLIMNYIVSLIIFPNFHIILHWIRTKIRNIRKKNAKKQLKKPIFNYCTFYALSLKSLFFAMLYSGSMPVFYLLCSLALAIQIILGKILMKYFVQEPVFVDNEAIQVVTKIIPYGLLLHCIMSILFLNVEQLIPAYNSYQNIRNDWVEVNLLKLQRGFIYVILIITLGIYLWNRERIDRILLNYWFGRSQSKVQCDQTRRFKQIKLNPAFLASYKMKDHPKYKLLCYALHLFCSHMQKIRKKGKLISLQSKQQLNVSNVYTEQNNKTKIVDLYEKESMLRTIATSPKEFNTQSVSNTKTEQDQQYIQYKGEQKQQQKKAIHKVGQYSQFAIPQL